MACIMGALLWAGEAAAASGSPVVPPAPPRAPTQDLPWFSATPANVMFLVDNSESMLDFPRGQELPEDFTPGFSPPAQTTQPGKRGWIGEEGDFVNTGCTDPALVAAMSWFDKDSSDPAKNGSIVYDPDPALGANPFFDPDKLYHARGRRVAWQTEDYPYSFIHQVFPQLRPESQSLNSCFQVFNWNTRDYYFASQELQMECQTCLATKGWWRGPRISGTTISPLRDNDYPPSKAIMRGEEPPAEGGKYAYRKWVVTGRVLNVRPPQFVVARKVLKDVITAAPNVRMGVATFGLDYGWFDPANVLQGLRPSCEKSFPSIDETELNRPLLHAAVNRIPFNNSERSTGEALFALGGYFSSQKQDSRWSTWFANPIQPGPYWPGCCTGSTNDNPDTGQSGFGFGSRAPDEWFKPPYASGPVFLPGQPWEQHPTVPNMSFRSVCQADQANTVIVITNGAPRYDNAVPITRMMERLMAQGARHPDGSLVYFDPTQPLTNLNSGGINYCDQFTLEDPPGSGLMRQGTQADCDYTAYNWPHGMAVGNKNFMDDVSFFLAHTDLRGDLPGPQSVRTSVVGYGSDHLMLRSIAHAGQGQFYPVSNGVEMKAALESILTGLSPPPLQLP